MSKFKKTTLATALLLVTAQSSAAGFQVSEHSASGLGRAFAGEAAVADNASVIARNPAAMSRFKKAELSIAGSYVMPNVDITGTKDAQISAYLNRDESALDASDIAPNAFIPAAYYIQPINDKFAVGLAMFSGYGVTTEYDENYVAGSLGGNTELMTFNINPNVSFKATEQLSLGLGVSAVYGSATLERNYGDLIPAITAGKGASAQQIAGSANPGAKLFKLEGDDWAFGWNAGILFELNENNRFGLAYRSQVDLEFSGEFTKYSPNGSVALNTSNATLELPLAATAEFSAYHKLTSAFAISYGVVWTQWSSFTELKAVSSDCGSDCFLKEEEFKDNYRYAIGAEYTIDNLILRAGLAYDQAAGETTLNIPETDRRWYTAGATYNVNQDLSFDFGAAYIASDDVEFTETDKAGSTYSFKSSGDAIIVSAQANYRF
ncbi:outer membrane protein transport protein [Moritella sp. 28]|uniref:outer membrane protein transport protein n=1 Tax=Moritella sp. 28 TaxID=2746232 RepID=UPI001BA4AF0D|nr:outer membrane protein transport protein [Moritella sp. 28]QUM85878.1 outer membrane protein transport protein [Moritella sp. 28]